jgi:hypothetical protein
VGQRLAGLVAVPRPDLAYERIRARGITSSSISSAPRGTSFYPIGFYRRRWDGAIPKDAATEDEVLAPGLPVVGGIYRTNGASIASIYPEAAWMGLFTFTPDT